MISPNAPIVALATEALKHASGKKPKLVGFPWTSDAGILNSKGGIPTVVFGPGGPPYYTFNERISTEELITATKAYAFSVAELQSLSSGKN